jgi:hypothetical protein
MTSTRSKGTKPASSRAGQPSTRKPAPAVAKAAARADRGPRPIPQMGETYAEFHARLAEWKAAK